MIILMKILRTIIIIPFAILAWIIGLVSFPVIMIMAGIMDIVVVHFIVPNIEEGVFKMVKNHFMRPWQMMKDIWNK